MTLPTLDRRALNRATLDRQLLLRREPLPVEAAVRRLVGLQAQEAASPYVALWTRLAGFEATSFDRALTSRALLKSTLMRITLHNVVAEDYPTFYTAMAPSLRSSRVHDKRFAPAGVSLDEVAALLQDTCRFVASGAHTGEELAAWLGTEANRSRVTGDPKVAWWALKTFGPWTRVPEAFDGPQGRPWGYPGDRYALAADPSHADAAAQDFEAAVQHLLLRYLTAYGPSSANDFARFTLLRSPVVTSALKACADQLVRYEGPDGEKLYDRAGASLPEPETPAPVRLLPMFDNLYLGHVQSSRVLPAEFRPRVARVNGDLLPTVLVEGWVAGVWRVVDGGLEVTAFRTLTAEQWDEVAAEATALLQFLAPRDQRVFSRFHHWWAKGLEGEQTRVFSPR